MSSGLVLCSHFFQTALLYCIIFIFIPSAPKSFASSNSTDSAALLAFKSEIHDPRGAMNSWNESIHFCQWGGVTCGRRHRRVTKLDLNSMGLEGSLSPSLGNLSFLREINLHNNTLRGEIPSELGNLLRLQILLLMNNSLVGNIPANLSRCTNIRFLHLGHNNLVGNIPFEIRLMTKLEVLALHENHLVGGIPSFLGNLTSLRKLSLAHNLLGGTIPDELGGLKSLTALGLGDNNLSGIIPPSIYNLSSIIIFSVSQNSLHGSLPQNLGLFFPYLQLFEISSNLFSGSIPVSLSNASNLQILEIFSNSLSGKVFVDFGGMLQLGDLNMGNNLLGSGEPDELSFLTSLVNCSNLQHLDFGHNKFMGALPSSIANLSTKLGFLNMLSNQLYGDIPSGIGNLANLYLLDIGYNQFTGAIPAELGKLHNLQYMSIARNKVSGDIPSSLGNITSLAELYLMKNKLQKTIPPSLGQCQRLMALDLSQNELVGSIPQQIFGTSSQPVLLNLNLSGNHLAGSMPLDFGNLKNIVKLDVSYNRLSGEIPKGLTSCTRLQILHMQANSLNGSIPQSISSMKELEFIDISHNKLSGRIPNSLETLHLAYLNLSFNNFEGDVPSKGVFANASGVSVAGNTMLCGGISELGLPKCSQPKNMHLVVKIIISLSCAFLGAALLTCSIFWMVKRRNVQESSTTVLMKELAQVSYNDLLEATDGFSSANLVGEGNFGSVYKGTVDKLGEFVAIKVLKLQNKKAAKSFLAECKALASIRHRNLVKVITCCSSVDFQGNEFKALVYQFMINGSLDTWLHQVNDRQVESQTLGLLQRINIAIDVACAVDYLHHHNPTKIIHCDLKPSNILLDADMTAHVSDFGLVKFLSGLSTSNESSSIGVRGTVGYTAPEYGLGSQVSTYGDVYSYGILLLEMMTGKRPTEAIFEEGQNLHSHASLALPNRVVAIVDPVLLNDGPEDDSVTNHWQGTQIRDEVRNACVASLVQIGVVCSMESPQERMDIKDVIVELQKIKNMFIRNGRSRS
ncbi:hypothetical protein DM860_003683 [Cuscuta australis]|uniref:non-specific serine/threonine protein kinase n=1 Tax=Cuscuta australis TaxID=267555 RepID=A0A328DHE9_9ASTE|nr:hypothetical protein DM860_003683 [Cuscuta australis]